MPLDTNACDSAFKTFVKFAITVGSAGTPVKLGQKLGV